MMRDTVGIDRGPAWVNKLTYAHYLIYFEELGARIKKVWYVWHRIPDDFYARHIEKLKPYPRDDLDRNFMCVIIKRPKHKQAGHRTSKRL